MSAATRQRIMEGNRSIRLIKTELESLLDKRVLTQQGFNNIYCLLPAETPLSGSLMAHGANGLNSPSPTPSESTASSVDNTDRATTPVPQTPHDAPWPLPGQSLAPNGKPVLRYAHGSYSYAGTDTRDCSFEKGDRIAVYEFMNPDWWMGQNLRTGDEGIFPRTYVGLELAPPQGVDMDEKRDGSVYPQAGGNPYNAGVPPMAVAEQGPGAVPDGAGNGRLEQGAKRFGKKLGNAAIFGAGMTIGSDIVNSIL